MKKLLLAATLTGALAGPWTAQAAAPTPQYGAEICVNASLAAEARRRFPNASIHVLADFTDREMNGWRIVSGAVDSHGRVHTDAEEVKLRLRDRYFRAPGE